MHKTNTMKFFCRQIWPFAIGH